MGFTGCKEGGVGGGEAVGLLVPHAAMRVLQ